MVGAVGKLGELNVESHSVFRIVHIGSDLYGNDFLCCFVENQRHGIARFQIILDDELDLVGHLGDGADGDVALGVGLLDQIFVWGNILLCQSFHLLGVVFVFFFFLLDDVLLEAATFFGSRRWVEGGLYGLAIGAVADLIVLGLFEFTFQTDIDLLGPGVLAELLLILRSGLLDLGDAFLEFLVLSDC